MPTQLNAGHVDTFDAEESMAKEIEKAVNDLMGLPPADPRERRRFFVAIARGVISHLKQRQAAFEIHFSVNGSAQTIDTHPNIQVQP